MFSSECLEISKNIFFIEYLSVTTSEPLLHDGRKKKVTTESFTLWALFKPDLT